MTTARCRSREEAFAVALPFGYRGHRHAGPVGEGLYRDPFRRGREQALSPTAAAAALCAQFRRGMVELFRRALAAHRRDGRGDARARVAARADRAAPARRVVADRRDRRRRGKSY